MKADVDTETRTEEDHAEEQRTEVAFTGDEVPAIGQLPAALREVAAGAQRLVSLQMQIWLARAKLSLRLMIVFVAFIAAAILVGLLTVIFLDLGLFHLLTENLHMSNTAAYLIFGAGHLLLTVGLVFAAMHTLRKDNPRQVPAADHAGQSGKDGRP